MTDFTVSEMLTMQQNLQDKYKDKWEPISPDTGKNKMLWMIAEMGEVIDIVKKNSIDQIMEEGEIRKWFVEEMADVLMFYNDMMLCYGITVDELKQSYTEKYEKNMKRW